MSRCPSDVARRRSAGPAKIPLALLAAVMVGGIAAPVGAQEPVTPDSLLVVPEAPTDADVVRDEAGHPVMVDSALSRPNAVAPSHGPPGTEVRVEVSQLPAITPLWLGIGATRAGFEALSLVQSDRYGELTEVVEIPDWAGTERSHAFIVFDTQFRPLAVTREFHVTGDDGVLTRRGRVETIGEECALLRGEDQLPYAVVGAVEGLGVDDEVVVRGTVADARPEACEGRATIEADSIRPASGSETGRGG